MKMEEINVNEYIRLENGIILKYGEKQSVKIENNTYTDYSGEYEWSSTVVKHSPNIIDLIEVRDIVTVEEIDTEWERTVEVDEEGYIKYLKMYVGKEEKLKKILTHEQYEQNCYKLEEWI